MFGAVKKVKGNPYYYILKSIRREDLENPTHKVIKYFGRDLKGFYAYLEKKGLIKENLLRRIEETL